MDQQARADASAAGVPIAAEVLDEIAAQLRSHGHACSASLFAHALLHALRDEALAAQADGRLQAAAVGGGAARRRLPDLRGDRIAWLDAAAGPAQSRFLSACDGLRVGLNRRLLLGMETLEAHFALYAPGTHYRRHVDRMQHDDARVLSLTTYLNPAWAPTDGGALRLHLGEGALDVVPRLGTSVLFLSDEIAHEVLPARVDRWSIAGWFRRRPRR